MSDAAIEIIILNRAIDKVEAGCDARAHIDSDDIAIAAIHETARECARLTCYYVMSGDDDAACFGVVGRSSCSRCDALQGGFPAAFGGDA